MAVDPLMRRTLEMVERAAASSAGILIEGETGTGKSLLATLAHRISPRADGPLVAIDCASLPSSLLESELFGHERGAFTGAEEGKRGRVEFAQGGTLLLEEISELSPPAQAKLLRLIEEKKFHRLGGQREIAIDARIIATTNSDLGAAVARGSFRSDLYYRLNVISIKIPPLRRRPKDILPLARFFLKRLSRRHGKPVLEIDDDAARMLIEYDWPGNVRELENAMERAIIIAEAAAARLGRTMLPPHLHSQHRGERKPTLAEVEKSYIEEVLEYTNWHKSRAAEILGIHRKTLLEKRKLYGIK